MCNMAILDEQEVTLRVMFWGCCCVLNVTLTLVIFRNFEGSRTRLFLAPWTVFHPPSSTLCTPAGRTEWASLSSVASQFDNERVRQSANTTAPIKTEEKDKRNCESFADWLFNSHSMKVSSRSICSYWVSHETLMTWKKPSDTNRD